MQGVSAPYLHDKYDDEVELEKEMMTLGRERVKSRIDRARDKGQMGDLRPHRKLLASWIKPVGDYLSTWIELSKKKRGPTPVALPLLELVDPDVAAMCAIRVVLRLLGVRRRELMGMAYEIGTWIEHEARADAWMEADPKGWKALEAHYRDRGSDAAHMRRSRVSIFNRHLFDKLGWEEWSGEQRRRVGLQMIDCIIQATRRFHIGPDPFHADKLREKGTAGKLSKGKDGKGVLSASIVLIPDDELEDWIRDSLDDELLHKPAYMPTLIPPKPWTNPRDGGYWTPFVKAPFMVKFGAGAEWVRQNALEEWMAADMPEVYEAVNNLQNTAWRINPKVYEVMELFWSRDLALAGFPSQAALVVPDKPPEADTIPEIRKKWTDEAHEIHTLNAQMLEDKKARDRTMWLAKKLKDEPAFYFPHVLDFRGRAYPVTTDLSPQGDDVHRGLLTFTHGKPVAPEDACWLAINLANCWGVDKVSLDDRVAWVEERRDLWLSIADDPVWNRQWLEADGGDSPWQALAAVFEWVGYLRDPDNFISTLPIKIDGTCNGIQHLATLTRNEDMGRSVNLVPSDKPMDIYREVALVLTAALKLEAETGAPEDARKAQVWLEFCNGMIPRSLSKRPVMILPYGGTMMACVKYVGEWMKKYDKDGSTFGKKDGIKEYGGWLAKRLWNAVRERLGEAQETMEWLQANARIASKAGGHISWRTPCGFYVRQFYSKPIMKQIKCSIDGQRVDVLSVEPSTMLDERAAVSGIAPNFIHSLDASCLMTTINLAKDNGIDSITTIHDAFGSVAADMWKLFGCVREAFIITHEGDPLAEFQEWCRSANPEATDWPKPLRRKGLILEAVRDSDYFFA